MAQIKKILSPAPEKTQQSGSNSALGKFLSNKDSIHYNDITPKEISISTGSLLLDADIKVRSGQVISLVGKGAEIGKTSQAFVFAENYMKTMPKSKTLYVKAEGRLSQEMKWRSGLTFVYKQEEWTEGTVFVLCCNVAGDVFQLIDDILQGAYDCGENICFIVDSLDGLILKDDLKEKKISDSAKVAGVPLLTKLFFRHCALPIFHYDALGILLSQYSAQIKASEYAPVAPNHGSSSGGSSKQHQSDYVFDYNRVNQGDLILEDQKAKPSSENKTLGKLAKLTILKSASGVTWQVYEIPIRKADENHKGAAQIWVEKEIVDFLLSYGLLIQSGAWFSFLPEFKEEASKDSIELPEKLHGMKNVCALLEENQVAREYLYTKIKRIISK